MKTEPNISKPIPLGCPNPADLSWTDATQIEAAPKSVAELDLKNVGNTQNLPAEPAEITQRLRNVGKRKTPADLLELIPSESAIPQAKLFEAARAAGINEKCARQFLSVLITEKGILVQKIPREKAKSALGYVRARLTDSPKHVGGYCHQRPGLSERSEKSFCNGEREPLTIFLAGIS